MEKWNDYEPEITGIAARLTTDRMLQQDLAQEMRVHLWRAPSGKTKGWYLSSARWQAVKFMTRVAIDCPDGDLDRQVILYGVLGDVDPEVVRYVPADWQDVLLTSPVDMVPETMALSVEVNDTLSLLTNRQQQIVYALAQGFTQGEVAEALGLSRRTIATEMGRIRDAFREIRETVYPGRT